MFSVLNLSAPVVLLLICSAVRGQSSGYYPIPYSLPTYPQKANGLTFHEPQKQLSNNDLLLNLKQIAQLLPVVSSYLNKAGYANNIIPKLLSSAGMFLPNAIHSRALESNDEGKTEVPATYQKNYDDTVPRLINSAAMLLPTTISSRMLEPNAEVRAAAEPGGSDFFKSLLNIIKNLLLKLLGMLLPNGVGHLLGL